MTRARPSPLANELLEGLERLRYRGDDTTGIALVSGRGIVRARAGGPPALLRQRVDALGLAAIESGAGLAHTRWSTHGGTGETAAHPHVDCFGRFAIVHNGVVENDRLLRRRLEGHQLESEGDSELIAHLIEDAVGRLSAPADVATGFARVLEGLEGPYAVCMLDAASGALYAASRLNPLLVATSPSGHAVVSDASALPPTVRSGLFLQPGEIAVASRARLELLDFSGSPKPIVLAPIGRAALLASAPPPGGWMASEMAQQTEVLPDLLLRRGEIQRLAGSAGRWLGARGRARRVRLVACGSSYNAALWGAFLLRRLGVSAEARRPLECVQDADSAGVLHIVLSQSGETLDLLRHVENVLAQDADTRLLGLVNGPHSTLARLLAGRGGSAGSLFDLGVGPEKGVVATKSYTAQVVALSLLGAGLRPEAPGIVLPERILGAGLAGGPGLSDFADAVRASRAAMVVAGPEEESAAREIALKLKELAYRMVEFVALDDLKHGPLAAGGPEVPAIVLLPRMEERRYWLAAETAIHLLHTRGVPAWAVCDESQAASLDGLPLRGQIVVPASHWALRPVFHVLPFQSVARSVSLQLGEDPDRPRNLAKAVTV